ncbi:biopolymer transporter ExbD [Nodosilinea sp. LEGE 06152]|uniref:ExbD/TolR family protein n=1 Tax=Nodosilinea sp. LEGE 06152 TaxID=2777966 RepID=UPI0018801601|nr:biopolymer transporter ExbD [Nodosilinea sp. LEGE 06152]MBE9158864.1 biopolymer transporter ExbD [Nodosilinea sp. LEGE 06152]
MHLPEDPELPIQINIVPMIDVVFAVLAFFILSSLLLTRNEGLLVALPSAETAEAQAQRQVVVTLNANGEVFVGNRAVTDEQLLEAIRTLGTLKDGGLIVIQADQSVSHGRVVAVMDRLRSLPGVQLAIATEGSQP